MKCKLGGDDYRNQEGYIEIDGLIICSDWDIDCQQCRVEELEAEVEKLTKKLERLPLTTMKAINLLHELSEKLKASEAEVERVNRNWDEDNAMLRAEIALLKASRRELL